jgi:hypothetical protein
MSCSSFIVLLDLIQPGYLKFAPFQAFVSDQANQIINHNDLPIIKPAVNIIKDKKTQQDIVCNQKILEIFDLECKKKNTKPKPKPNIKPDIINNSKKSV